MPRRDTDEAHGHRGDLPPSEHLEVGAGAQDLPVSAAEPGSDAAEPGLGDGHHLRGLWRAASSTSPPSSTGSAAGSWPGGCRSRCRRTSRIEALEEALGRHGRPDIFNTDQGSQFTSADFTAVLKAARVAISMDGRGAWRDNVFVERLWRSVKYEEVYLRAYASVSEARASIGRHLGLRQRQEAAFVARRADARPGLLQPPDANPGGGVTRAEIHSATAQKLFRQTEPPLPSRPWSAYAAVAGDL